MTTLQPHIWQQIIQYVVANGGQILRPWFSQLQPIALDHGLLEIQVPGAQEQAYCRQHATGLFTEAAQAATGRLVSVCFLPQSPQPPAPETFAANPFAQGELLLLNDDYTFENFVTGPCNRLAHAACLAISDSPGKTYNPLFIYGSAGLGKTHLLQAVCRSVLLRGPARIAYVSCESFINMLIEAIQLGRLHEFRYRYRQVDVLVIDDVQFLSNHEQTQEEFFHTFNTLYQAQKQIILSCDRQPGEIPHLEERLVSRFNWGLVAGIDRPGYETRVAIVRKKAAARSLSLPEDVICFIAGVIESNARELEGALTRISMLSQVLEKEVDLALAQEALGNTARRTSEVAIEQIIDSVCRRFGVRLADLQSRKRTKSICLPRQVCMYLARSLTRHSLEEIGGYFGGRDHTTVLHSLRAVEGRRQEDAALHSTLEQLSQELSQSRMAGPVAGKSMASRRSESAAIK